MTFPGELNRWSPAMCCSFSLCKHSSDAGTSTVYHGTQKVLVFCISSVLTYFAPQADPFFLQSTHMHMHTLTQALWSEGPQSLMSLFTSNMFYKKAIKNSTGQARLSCIPWSKLKLWNSNTARKTIK